MFQCGQGHFICGKCRPQVQVTIHVSVSRGLNVDTIGPQWALANKELFKRIRQNFSNILIKVGSN